MAVGHRIHIYIDVTTMALDMQLKITVVTILIHDIPYMLLGWLLIATK